MKTRLKNWLHDAMRALWIGLLLTAALSAALLILFGIVSGFQLTVMGSALRSGLLAAGGLTLFGVAGSLLRTESSHRIRQQDGWARRFHCFGLTAVLLILAVMILAAGGLVDHIIRAA